MPATNCYYKQLLLRKVTIKIVIISNGHDEVSTITSIYHYKHPPLQTFAIPVGLNCPTTCVECNQCNRNNHRADVQFAPFTRANPANNQ